MARQLLGAEIVTRLTVDAKKLSSGLRKAESSITGVAKKIQAGVKKMHSGIVGITSQMEDQASSYATIAAMTWGPIIGAMTRFANAVDANQERLKVLYGQLDKLNKIKATGGIAWMQRAKLIQEIMKIKRLEAEMHRAKQAQQALMMSFRDFADELGRLIWEALGPYVPWVIRTIRYTIEWMKTNKEFVKDIVIVTAKVGAFSAGIGVGILAIAKILRILGGVIGILGAINAPMMIVAATLGLIWYIFGEKLKPVLEEHTKKIKELFWEWGKGEKTTREAVKEIGKILWNFLYDVVVAIGMEINSAVNEWFGGKLNEKLTMLFETFIELFSNFDDFLASFWQSIKDTFWDGVNYVIDRMNDLKNMLYAAVGASWFTDYMRKMADVSEFYSDKVVAGFFKMDDGLKSLGGGFRNVGSRLSSNYGYNPIVASGYRINAGNAGVMTNSFNFSGYVGVNEFAEAVRESVERVAEKTMSKIARRI